MSQKWTDAQQRAIQTVGKTLLVSAGAGAGKTAVLTERCLFIAVDRKPPTELSRILVVTFTEAAAAEMRQRIGDALRARLDSDENDAHLRRQLLVLEQSPISTLHSFCLRLLREYFYELNLDPQCRVMDEDELLLLQEEILTEVFEDFYAFDDAQGERFRALVDCYGGVSGDMQLRGAVLDLHRFLTGVPDSKSWLEETMKQYASIASATSLNGLPWFEEFERLFEEDLDALVSFARKTCQRKDIQEIPKFDQDAKALLGQFETWQADFKQNGVAETSEKIRAFQMPRKPTDRNASEGAMEALGALRDEFKKGWLKAASMFDTDDWLHGIQRTQPHATTLCEVYQKFREALTDAKKRAGCIDFSDMEHLCLRLLSDASSPAGQRLPSVTALNLRQRYDHILVDEYQDINPVQDEILRLLSRDGSEGDEPNLFMVGDVKQSIYGFRLADPGLFVQKHKTFPDTDDAPQMRISLRENFRSRRNIINGVNALFQLLMTESVADIQYDASQQLVCAAHYPETALPTARDLPIEIHLLERRMIAQIQDETPDGEEEEMPGKAEGLEQADKEACIAARAIQDIVTPEQGEPLQVWDKDRKDYRNATYRDIVVLLRTVKEKAARFADVLRRSGIPVYAESGTGYLRATEIQDMLSLLNVLDNPRQDIALAATLRSPIFGVKADDLLRIRRSKEDGDFFTAVTEYAQVGSDDLAEQLREILKKIESWRTLARQRPLSSVVWELLQQTEYLSYVSGLERGALRRANLLKLHNRSMQFDRFTRQGLARFLQFIEQMEEVGADYGEAPYLSEAEDVVRIMSIHKSKGLEFPIVIVPDLGKAFNLADECGDILFDREMLLAMKAVELDRMIKYPTIAHEVVSTLKHERILAEEMRVLYVALTRAKEKLVLIGSVRTNSVLKRWERLKHNDDATSAPEDMEDHLKRAKNIMDWVGPAITVLSDGDFPPSEEDRTDDLMFFDIQASGFFRVIMYSQSVLETLSVQSREREKPLIPVSCLESLSQYQPEQIPVSSEVAQILDQVQWRYPYESVLAVPSKMSISEIKRRFDLEQDSSESEPALEPARLSRRSRLMQEQQTRTSSMERGLLTHLVIQHLDLSQPLDEDDLRRQMKQMMEQQLITEEQVRQVWLDILVRFFQSELGSTLRQYPEKTRREVPFSLAVSAKSIIPQLPEEAHGETVLVQGIIDCLLEEPDGFTLIDFKTDRVTEEQIPERASKYNLQMDIYRQAVQQAFNKPVKKTILYFLQPGVAHSM